MKSLVSIIKFYLLGLLFSCLTTWSFNTRRAAIEFCKSPLFWIGPLFFILLGLAVGGLLLILNPPENGKRFLFYGTLTGYILFCIISTSFQVNDWYHLKYSAKIEHNIDFINTNSSYPLQEKQAFYLLTDKYNNPNDLILTEISVTRYDSMVDRAKTDAYDVGFVYFRKNRTGHYKSRCTIIGAKGNFQYFDRSLNDAEEHVIDSSNNEGLRDGLQAILEDSGKLSLDSAAKVMIRTKLKSKTIALDTLPGDR